MGIKGLPEQLKHYYRDAQVEQFKGAPRFSFRVVVVVRLNFIVFVSKISTRCLFLSFSLRFFEKIFNPN